MYYTVIIVSTSIFIVGMTITIVPFLTVIVIPLRIFKLNQQFLLSGNIRFHLQAIKNTTIMVVSRRRDRLECVEISTEWELIWTRSGVGTPPYKREQLWRNSYGEMSLPVVGFLQFQGMSKLCSSTRER